MMSQDKVTSHFKKHKAEPRTIVGKTRSAAKQETQAQQQQQQQGAMQMGSRTEADLSGEDQALRAFDLTYKFGPCAGMTRLERWERASKLGLDPPQEVLAILNKHGPNSAADQNIWHNRI